MEFKEKWKLISMNKSVILKSGRRLWLILRPFYSSKKEEPCTSMHENAENSKLKYLNVFFTE